MSDRFNPLTSGERRIPGVEDIKGEYLAGDALILTDTGMGTEQIPVSAEQVAVSAGRITGQTAVPAGQVSGTTGVGVIAGAVTVGAEHPERD